MKQPLQLAWDLVLRFRLAFLLAGGYVALVAWVAFCFIPPHKGKSPISYRAGRALATNTQLGDGDLAEPENPPLGYFWSLPDKKQFSGKYYVGTALPKDKEVNLDDLRSHPVVTPMRGQQNLLISLHDRPSLKDVVTPGCTLDLYGSDPKKPLSRGTVTAIMCGKDSPSCYAVVPLDAASADAVAKEPNLKVVLVGYP